MVINPTCNFDENYSERSVLVHEMSHRGQDSTFDIYPTHLAPDWGARRNLEQDWDELSPGAQAEVEEELAV
jgi:hypothetical protein